ncbi:MAG: Arm DNA-binding domain-containing protein [Bacteroidota bacterium]
MSASAKIVLRKKPNSQGLYPLAICITKNRRSPFKHIGQYIQLEEWGSRNLEIKKSNPNAEEPNNLITSKLSEARRGLISLQTENKDASARQMKEWNLQPKFEPDSF